jgi:hypothetical protein
MCQGYSYDVDSQRLDRLEKFSGHEYPLFFPQKDAQGKDRDPRGASKD